MKRVLLLAAMLAALVVLFTVSASAEFSSSSTFSYKAFWTANGLPDGVTVADVAGTSRKILGGYLSGSSSTSFRTYLYDFSVNYVDSSLEYVQKDELLIVSGSYTVASGGTASGWSTLPVITLNTTPYLAAESTDYLTIHTFDSSEVAVYSTPVSGGYDTLYLITYKIYAEILIPFQCQNTFTLNFDFSPLSNGYLSLYGFQYSNSGYNWETYLYGPTYSGAASTGNLGSVSNSLAVSLEDAGTSDIVGNAANQIVSSINGLNSSISGMETQIELSNEHLIEIKNYCYQIYNWLNNAYNDPILGTVQMDWNHYCSIIARMFNYVTLIFDEIDLNITPALLAIKQATVNMYYAFGYTDTDTFRSNLEIYFSSVVSAIENQTDEILGWLEEQYGGVDTSGMEETADDVGGLNVQQSEIEGELFAGADVAIGGIDMETPSFGNQTLTAIASLLPFYNSFFNSSGEVGMLIIFSLTLGLVLLIIGRAAYMARRR